MKKLFAMLIAATLVLGVLAGPSAFAGKKKKKPATRTVTLEESGSMLVPAPTSIALFGITEGEFVSTCAMPASQGVDAWVLELPDDFRLGTAQIEVVGADVTGAHDIDVYFYDSGCGLMVDYSLTGGPDESGSIAPGAAWVVVDLFVGANATIDLKATATIAG